MTVEGTDKTMAPNQLPLTMMFDWTLANFIPVFLDVCARFMMTHKPLAVDAYAAFPCFASRVCETPAFAKVADSAFQSFLHALQLQCLPTEDLATTIEDTGFRSTAHLDVLVKEILPSSFMHIRDGIASRWLTSLPKLAEVAVRRPHFSSQINGLITTVLTIYLVWDVGPVPQPDYVLSEKCLNCECQYCSTINLCLAERNDMEFNSASLRWSWVMCRHINEKHRHATEMNMKTITDLRRTQGNPYFLNRKIDRAYNDAPRAQ